MSRWQNSRILQCSRPRRRGSPTGFSRVLGAPAVLFCSVLSGRRSRICHGIGRPESTVGKAANNGPRCPRRDTDRANAPLTTKRCAQATGSPPLAFSKLMNLERGTRCGCFILVIIGLLAACAGPKLPAPNSADVRYDGRDRAVQVMVSNLQPPTAAALVANDGTRYPASGIALVSGPHVLYNPPPSIGLGIGGFGFSGCCSGFGSGVGIGVPVGRPTPAEVSDQYVASALIPVPPDYGSNWSRYRVEVSAGAQPMSLAAPAPAE